MNINLELAYKMKIKKIFVYFIYSLFQFLQYEQSKIHGSFWEKKNKKPNKTNKNPNQTSIFHRSL